MLVRSSVRPSEREKAAEMDLASQGSYPTTPASCGGQSTHAQMAGERGREEREGKEGREGHQKSVEMQEQDEKVPAKKNCGEKCRHLLNMYFSINYIQGV